MPKRRFDDEEDGAVYENVKVIERKRKNIQAKKLKEEETVESVLKKYDSLDNVFNFFIINWLI